MNVEAQLGLERAMVARGIENYERATQKAENSGRGSETTYGRKLLAAYIQPVAEGIRDITAVRSGRQNPVRVLAGGIDPEKAAFLTLQVLLNSFTYDAALASVATKIGQRIEDEARFSRFEQQHGEYYRDFQRKGTQSYRHKRRVLVHVANREGDSWTAWTAAQRATVGTRLLDIVLARTPLVEKREYRQHGKTIVRLLPTEHALQQVQECNEFAKLLFPEKMPCLIAPDPWTGPNQGGYYSPELRRSTPMVKTAGKRHRRAVEGVDLSKVMDALNAVQAVPWAVNAPVLAVMLDAWKGNLGIGIPHSEPLAIPPSPFVDWDKESLTEAELAALTDWKHEAAELHTQERERQSKALLATRIIRMAEQFQEQRRFWYVWYADFRGRLYSATAGFSPQGPDMAKSLLRFADGKPIGERGWYWLRVHGANRFGYDKVSYDARVAWVDANRESFLAAAAEPLSHTELWGKADKPWQFLAFLFEYRDALALEAQGGVHEFVSHLPIGLDGSCNGLQNFSAVLRDHVGGRATNLIPGDKPADIYSEVAKVCTGKLNGLLTDPEQEQMARLWLSYCDKHGKGSLPRSMAKRPVMTLPYGATRQSCTKYIFADIVKTDREHFPEGNFPAACWLTEYLWESIGEVVVAARDAMAWLQKCSSVMSKLDSPMTWELPDGFVVYQGARKIEVQQIDTQLAGRFRLNVGQHTDEIDSAKQRSGIAPNFVHSLDAAHLRETVRRASAEGIEALAVIHDDYGTHAADTDALHRIIREAFVVLYKGNDPLEAFRVAQAEKGAVLPAVPTRGALRVEDVLASRYFFG